MLRILLLLCVSTGLWAQTDFKIAAGGKTIEFREIDRLSIVGSAGSEMIVEGSEQSRNRDERAAGLRKISATGLRDNTGFGLSVTEEGGRILVQQVGGDGKSITVRVPNSATVKVEQTTHRGGGIEVSDFSGALDVSMMYHKARLKNVTGPTAVNTVYSDIIAVYDTPPTKDTRLHSSYSNVDVTLPAATKADLRLSSGYGDMYTDFDIEVKPNMETTKVAESGKKDEDCNCDAKEARGQLVGTINGGGPLLSLSATYSNLYIRKK